MTRRLKMSIAAAIAMLAAASVAKADLLGTEMTIEILHTGLFSQSAGGVHQYGRTDSYFTDLGLEVVVSSPAFVDGFDNAIAVDLSNFAYGDLFGGGESQVTISGIAEDVLPGSVTVFAGGTDITSSATGLGDVLVATWSVDTVMNVTFEEPAVVIAWNSVPAPGGLALLGLAALASNRRRRRS